MVVAPKRQKFTCLNVKKRLRFLLERDKTRTFLSLSESPFFPSNSLTLSNSLFFGNPFTLFLSPIFVSNLPRLYDFTELT